MKTIALNVAVAALISVVLLWGNTLYRQHVQFGKGEKAFGAGDFNAALAGFEAAIHMYTPFSPTVEKGAQRLWQLGSIMEQRGDLPRALIAYRSLRSSFYSARWFAQPGEEWIRKCDARIAALVQRQAGQAQLK